MPLSSLTSQPNSGFFLRVGIQLDFVIPRVRSDPAVLAKGSRGMRQSQSIGDALPGMAMHAGRLAARALREPVLDTLRYE
jgi:hypothetical protein